MANEDPRIGGPAKKKFKLFTDPLENTNQSQKVNQPYIMDLVTLEKVFLQSIPLELSVSPESGWAVVGSPGRNNPLYQYTGGEDTISFTITWYADHESKQDVLKKCKWLEALSRNDGYDDKPHPVQFVFGDMFKRSKWIMYSASYRLGNFDRTAGMMPKFATQDITLKKITEVSASRNEILKIDT